jgi:hypothetical protein
LITTYGEGISKPDTNLLAFDIKNASKDGNFIQTQWIPTQFEWIGNFFTNQVWWLKVGYRYCLPEPDPKYINNLKP